MVITGNAQPDRAIALVGDFGVFDGVEVEVDHVVQRADHRFDHGRKIGFVRNVDVAEHEGSEVADDEFAGLGHLDDDFVPVLRFHGAGNEPDLRHVLRDFRTEIGAVDHARVRIGIHPVDVIAVEAEGRARLHGGF